MAASGCSSTPSPGVRAHFHGSATAEEMITWVRVNRRDPMEPLRDVRLVMQRGTVIR